MSRRKNKKIPLKEAVDFPGPYQALQVVQARQRRQERIGKVHHEAAGLIDQEIGDLACGGRGLSPEAVQLVQWLTQELQAFTTE